MTKRSADAAFEMLMKFKYIETREGIHQKLMKQFDETLRIYIVEVRNVKDFFDVSIFGFDFFKPSYCMQALIHFYYRAIVIIHQF